MTARLQADKVAALRAMPFGRKLIYAVKIASWPKLFAPTLLGQAVGVADAGRFSLAGLLLGLAFSVLDVVYVVLLNDWGDREVDAIKRSMFPDGCSPKTIPDRILPATTLLLLGLGAGAGALVLAAIAGPRVARPHFFALAVASLLMFAIYTFKPLALNYRGGGELLETLGVGLLLPWLNTYLQSGRLLAAPPQVFFVLVPGLALLALSSALASGISDEESDRAGKKRTFATTFGNARTRQWVIGSYLGGALLLAVVPAVLLPKQAAWVAPAVLLLAACFPAIRATSGAALTNAFPAQNRFKGRLHAGLWGAQLVLGASLVIQTLFTMV